MLTEKLTAYIATLEETIEQCKIRLEINIKENRPFVANIYRSEISAYEAVLSDLKTILAQIKHS